MALLGLCGLVAAGSGCAAAKGAFATVGFFGYEANEVAREHDVAFEQACQATREALVDLGFHEPAEEECDPTRMRFIVEDVAVDVARHAGSAVRVEVRIGRFESQDGQRLALLISEEIAYLLESSN
ncbi:MAG: hypothetical protein WD226_06350 [Planctomycetota bacterium]